METVQAKTTTHPLFMAAAGSLIVVSALGSAAIMGWLPRSAAEPNAIVATAPAASVAVAPVATLPTPPVAVKPAAPAAPRVIARAEPRPAVKHHAVQHQNPRSEPRPVVREAVQPAADYDNGPYQSGNRRADEERPVLAQSQEPAPYYPSRSLPPICKDCGVIESVNAVEKTGDGSGLGAVAGGVVGAIAGKQVGGGRGRNVMSVVGALGGAYAGHQVEKNVRKVKSYDVTVRFEDGTTRTLSQTTAPNWRSGDRVRMVNGTLQPA